MIDGHAKWIAVLNETRPAASTDAVMIDGHPSTTPVSSQ